MDDVDRARRNSFDRAVETYHLIRPGYPAELFEELFALLPPKPRMLEVGPGTGQATRDLLGRGATVHAIEIGAAMAAKLRAVLPADALTISVGDFEQVPDEEAVYDCVFSATAYHWIEPSAQRDRPAALLKVGGVLGIVDTIQVDSETDHGFFVASQEVYERHGEGYTGPPSPSRDQADPSMRVALERDDRFADVRVRRYNWDQTYTAAQYRDLLLSYSGTQSMEPATRAAFVDDMERFVRERFHDQVTRPLVVTLTTAVRATS